MPDSSLYQKRKDQNADVLLPRHLLHDCWHLPVIVRTRTAMQMEQYLRCDPFLCLARSDSSGLHPICRPRRNRKKHQKRLEILSWRSRNIRRSYRHRSTDQCNTALHRRHQLQTDRRKTVQRCQEHSVVRSRCRFLFLHFSLLRFQYACLF